MRVRNLTLKPHYPNGPRPRGEAVVGRNGRSPGSSSPDSDEAKPSRVETVTPEAVVILEQWLIGIGVADPWTIRE